MFSLGHFDLYGHSQPYIVGLLVAPQGKRGKIFSSPCGRLGGRSVDMGASPSETRRPVTWRDRAGPGPVSTIASLYHL